MKGLSRNEPLERIGPPSGRDIGDQILEDETLVSYFSPLTISFRALGITDFSDLGKYTRTELAKSGLNDAVLSALEKKTGFRDPDEVERIYLDGKVYLKPLNNGKNALWAIRGYDVMPLDGEIPAPKSKFKYLLVNGNQIRYSETGQKHLSTEQLVSLFKYFSSGKSEAWIAEKLGLTDVCVRDHLSRAGVILTTTMKNKLLAKKKAEEAQEED